MKKIFFLFSLLLASFVCGENLNEKLKKIDVSHLEKAHVKVDVVDKACPKKIVGEFKVDGKEGDLYYLVFPRDSSRKFKKLIRNNEGRLCENGKVYRHEFVLANFQNSADVVFISQDFKYADSIRFPNHRTIYKGQKYRAVLTVDDTEMFSIRFSGLEPKSDITVTSNSEGEIIPEQKIPNAVNQKGQVLIPVLPAVIGKTGGKCVFTLKGKSDKIACEFYWGDQYWKHYFDKALEMLKSH
ncbi:MAG: hypothetical protein K940chlam8_01144 [Chlamydiae bacterium]|nr:hypothetical protein [Chlamydiota bacterium]